jgi:hypothetical protein
MLQGLPVLQRKLDYAEGSLKSNLTSTPLVDDTFPKIDQREPSHSCTLHVLMTYVLARWNA